MIRILFAGMLIAGTIQYFRSKQRVAIWSADRKETQGKQPNIISRTFSSIFQPQKTNTTNVGATLGPQNPGGLSQ